MIVIINGPLGVGKTAVSWELVGFFECAVMLDGDYIGAVHPFEIYDEARIEYLYQTLYHLVAYHIEQGGYDNFVVNYVFETSESLARLRRMLSELDQVTYAFRLICDEEEMERRVRERARSLSTEPGQLDWELGRFRELAAIQDEAAQDGDMGAAIDTSGLSVKKVAQAIWDDIRREVRIVPYDPRWPQMFEAEKSLVEDTLGPLVVETHHIGSTTVPGLSAKPVIDIMVEVRRLEEALDCIAPLAGLGYEFIDHPQNLRRRFFRKGAPRTYHLHIVERGDDEVADLLDFRDALRDDPALAAEYGALKLELAERYKRDRAIYTEMKTAFVVSTLEAKTKHRE